MTAIRQHLIERLRLELKAYGLNPAEWQIHLTPRGRAASAQHREDPGLQLYGAVQSGQWQQLEFMGL